MSSNEDGLENILRVSQKAKNLKGMFITMARDKERSFNNFRQFFIPLGVNGLNDFVIKRRGSNVT